MNTQEWQELVDSLDEYIELMGADLTSCMSIAHVHGWKSRRIEQGEALRKKIAELRHRIKMSLNTITPEMYRQRTGLGGGIKEKIDGHKRNKNYKSRGNYPVRLCMRFDCDNRDSLCGNCIKFDKYVKGQGV